LRFPKKSSTGLAIGVYGIINSNITPVSEAHAFATLVLCAEQLSNKIIIFLYFLTIGIPSPESYYYEFRLV